jgi:hypothetical protein
MSEYADNRKWGIVCLVDALGAKNYTDEDIGNFLESRKVILSALSDKAEDQVTKGGIEDPLIAIFNDTIIIAISYKDGDRGLEKKAILSIGIIVRKLLSDGLSKGILFRGAIGLGHFYSDQGKDTIIGPAVSDAASWYEKPEFIGCIFTPRLKMRAESHYCTEQPPKNLFIKQTVPIKSGTIDTYCINWPKALFVSAIRPDDCKPLREREYLLIKLSNNIIPFGIESKYNNTLKFYDDTLIHILESKSKGRDDEDEPSISVSAGEIGLSLSRPTIAMLAMESLSRSFKLNIEKDRSFEYNGKKIRVDGIARQSDSDVVIEVKIFATLSRGVINSISECIQQLLEIKGLYKSHKNKSLSGIIAIVAPRGEIIKNKIISREVSESVIAAEMSILVRWIALEDLP